VGELDLLDRYPRANRAIDERGAVLTEDVRTVARRHGREFFDGDRKFGYGGYNYHPRFWTETVRRWRDHYGLADAARILDVGAAKGFTLYDFSLLMPEASFVGLDISDYAVMNAKPEVRDKLVVGNARDLPFPDASFDLVISINTVHNLKRAECIRAIREIQRVSRGASFLTVDAWRTEEERRRMEKWVLTAYTVLHVDEWKALFAEAGYTGDYYWFIA
jgi:ubiquinone/menaquinone biosynthesis C-methylase UbiE